MGTDPVHDVDLTAQLAGIGAAGELLQLGDKLHALALCEKGRRLYHINEQLQLRQLELPFAKKIAVGLAPDSLHIHAVQLQQLQVVIDAFALGGNTLAFQISDHILNGPGVALVCFLPQIPRQIQQLQLFIGHGAPSLRLSHCTRYGQERKPLFTGVRLYIHVLLGYNKVLCYRRKEVRRCK